MAWTPELRAKLNAKYLENIRTGKTLPRTGQKALVRSKIYPPLRHPTIEQMFAGPKKEAVLSTRQNAMKYVRLLSDRNPKLDALAVAWDKLTPNKQLHTSLDILCEKVDLPVAEFIALIAPKAYEMGHQLAKLFVGLAQPELAQVAIAAARDKERGFKDRQMMLQSGGTAPSPKGINIAVQQNNQVNATELPDFDSQTIDLADAVRGD